MQHPVKQTLTKAAIVSFLAIASLFSQNVWALNVGDMVPDVSAKNQNGKDIKFNEFKGHFLLVYFYPKDETPGCTKEACDLTDRYSKIKALNTEVLGISRQDSESHKKFIAKHKIPFDLLVDEKGDVAKAFGVKTMPVVGYTHRSSFLFGPDGKVVKIYPDVDAAKHAEEVMADIQALQKPVKQ